MNTTALYIFLAVSLAFLLMNVWTTGKVLRRDSTARWLGFSGIFAVVCVLTYIATVLTESVAVFAWMTSAHLIAVAIGLYCAWKFCYLYVRLENFRILKVISRIFIALVSIDIVALLVNPFKGIALEFALRTPESLYSKVVYAAQHPMYYFHMGVAYLLIVGILLLLGHGRATVPKEFGRQYVYTMVVLFFVLVFNIISVFVLGNRGYVNYSVALYSLLTIVMYVFAYKFSDFIMIDYFKDSVFENVTQSIVLFDFRGELVMCNKKAVRLFSMIDFSQKPTRKDFEKTCNIVIVGEKDIDTASLQCYVRQPSGQIPLRCDFRRLKNDVGVLMGYLYVFADIGLETDAVTGYQEWDGFKNFVLENEESFALPVTVIVSDINNLSVVNSVGGRSRGDQMLKAFASLLRKEFVENSYFVRGEGASLVVLAYNRTKEAVAEAMPKCTEAGALKVVELNVSGPFHSPLLKGAGDKLGKELESVELGDLKIPYIPNVNATPVTDKAQIKDLLKAQVSSPVMWEQTLRELEKMGVDTIIEVGPGRTIAGFVRKTVSGIRVIGVSTPEDIDKLLEKIG